MLQVMRQKKTPIRRSLDADAQGTIIHGLPRLRAGMSLGTSMCRALRAAGLAPVRGFLLLQKPPAATEYGVPLSYGRGMFCPRSVKDKENKIG